MSQLWKRVFGQLMAVLVTIAILGLARGVFRPLVAEETASRSGYDRHAQGIVQGRELIRGLMDSQKIPGVSVALWADGQFLWSEGFGYSDVESRVPVWPHTRFRIGSISKTLTAAAIGKLLEAGRLDLDAPVWHYVPSFPEKKYSFTTRQLAGHLAGIRHYRGTEFLIQRQYDTVLDGLTIFQHAPLIFPPGERYSYSSYGWNLISAVIEKASGQDYLRTMQQQVFGPICMRHTLADRPSKIITNRTRFYALDDNGQLQNAPPVNNSYKWAGGGFLSTPEDLVRFAAAHLREGFLKPETIQLLWTSQRTNAGDETGYGIGWRVSVDDQGRRRVGHGGGSVGGSSQLLVYPESKLIIAITANLSSVRYGDTHYRIAKLFLN